MKGKNPWFKLALVIALMFSVLTARPVSDPWAISAMAQQATQEWSPERDGIGDLTEGPPVVKLPRKRKPIPIVGQRFSPAEFARYVKYSVITELRKPKHWKPTFIVLHNTWKPTIAQLPNGFVASNMSGLATYYGVKMGWRSGPAAFIDQNGIWVFSGFTAPGTHSPSWNRFSWGIEQLGNFDQEQYDSGGGAKVRDNAIAALAILSLASNLDIETLRFHREDPETAHKDCPGIYCKKPEVAAAVQREMEKWRALWSTL